MSFAPKGNSRGRSPRRKQYRKQSGNSGGMKCYTCGRPGHRSPDCYAKTDKNGKRL